MDKTLIIIVTYNGCEHILQCLKNICNDVNLEILIIDNGSSDNTIDVIKNKINNVKLIKNIQNIGFGQANNIGLSYAIKYQFQYVLLLNQDTSIEVATIQRLISIQKEYPEYGILTPFHFYSENVIQKSFNNHIKANPKLIKDLKNNCFTSKIYDVPFINAAIWLLHISTIEKIGGFSPVFFHYGEDDNYCHRLQYFGLKIGVVPTLKAYHYSQDRHPQYFKDKKIELNLNQLKLKISNPNIRYNHKVHISILFIKIIYNFIFGKPAYKNHLIKLKASLHLNVHEIEMIKKMSLENSHPYLQVPFLDAKYINIFL